MPAYRAPIEATAPEKGPYRELAKLAEEWEAPYAGAPMLDVVFGGVPLRVELSLNSGVPDGATIEARGEWPELVLRKEVDEDRDGKKLGITRELQTGDLAFDEKVFIESDEPDASLREILGDADRRAAVLALIHFDRVCFSPTGILVRVRDVRAYQPGWLRDEVLVHLCKLAEGPRPAPTKATTPAAKGVDGIVIVGLVVLLIAMGAFVMVSWTLRRFAIGAVGGFVGFALWWPSRHAARRWLRGHSRSYDQYLVVSAGLFLTFVCGGWMLALLVDAMRP